MNTQAESQSTISDSTDPSTEIVPVDTEESSKKNYTVYTNEDRKNFAVLYALHGNVRQVAKIMELPTKTAYNWIKADWFPRFYDEAKREYAELIEARLSDIVEKATVELLDRLEYGDETLTKTGEIVRVKVSARDLTILLREGIDKIRLLQNKPQKLSAEVKFDVNQLERNLAEFADKYRDRVVSTQ